MQAPLCPQTESNTLSIEPQEIYQNSFAHDHHFEISTIMPLFPFLIYYGHDHHMSVFDRFITTVLEPEHYPNVLASQSECYAYLSVGEVHPARSYFSLLRKKNLLKKKHPVWQSYALPLSPFWQELIFEEIVPMFIEGGYVGIMLDTVESLLHYKLAAPKEIIAFIASLKERFPMLKIMLNRTFSLACDLPVDAILLESTLSGYDFTNNKPFRHTNPIHYDFSIPRYSVDYWDTDDLDGSFELYKDALSRGYQPLVTDISLQVLPSYAR